jgi:hypothetical protein
MKLEAWRGHKAVGTECTRQVVAENVDLGSDLFNQMLVTARRLLSENS